MTHSWKILLPFADAQRQLSIVLAICSGDGCNRCLHGCPWHHNVIMFLGFNEGVNDDVGELVLLASSGNILLKCGRDK